MENCSCQFCAGIALEDEVYLFADQANNELSQFKREYGKLLNRCLELEIKCNLLEAALDRSIDTMIRMEREYAQKISAM